MLAENGRASVSDIAQRFEISAATARRDVVSLVEAGKAMRTHGGVLPARAAPGEQHFRARASTQIAAKLHIAQRAVHLLPQEGRVFIDAGTTCLEVARLLIARPALTIFTDSVPVLGLAATARATIVSVGGEARRASLALTSAWCEPWGFGFHFDAAVVGASGLHLATGAYTTEIHEACVKAEALRRADMRMLVADAEKWRCPRAVSFAPWSAFSIFVTNQDVSRELRQSLSGRDVAIQLAA